MQLCSLMHAYICMIPGIILCNAPSQCNVVYHWLNACTKWSLNTKPQWTNWSQGRWQLRADSRFVPSQWETPGGGYSLCDGWYICAAVLTPFFHFGRIEHDLFGVFFSSTNSKAIFWGTKTTNFYKNRSFWPQIQFFLDLFGSNFQRPAAHPHQFSGRVPPPGERRCYKVTPSLIGSVQT